MNDAILNDIKDAITNDNRPAYIIDGAVFMLDKRDSRAQFFALASALEKDFQRAFLQAYQNIGINVAMRDLEKAIKAKNTAQILSILNITPETFDGLANEISKAVIAGGNIAIARIPKGQRLPNGNRANIGFTGRQPEAQRIITNRINTLIVDITKTQEQSIRTILGNATELSQSPHKTALELVGRLNKKTGLREGGVVGLTNKDTITTQKYARAFENGDVATIRQYAGLKIDGTDLEGGALKSSNKTINTKIKRQVIAYNKATTEAGRQAVLKEFRNLGEEAVKVLTRNLLRTRGITISATESIGAIGEGRYAGYKKIIDAGIVKKDTIERKWDATGDSKVRASHVAMDGQIRGIDGVFRTPNGALLQFPRDRSLGAPASEIIRCRCYDNVKIDFIKNRLLDR